MAHKASQWIAQQGSRRKFSIHPTGIPEAFAQTVDSSFETSLKQKMSLTRLRYGLLERAVASVPGQRVIDGL